MRVAVSQAIVVPCGICADFWAPAGAAHVLLAIFSGKCLGAAGPPFLRVIDAIDVSRFAVRNTGRAEFSIWLEFSEVCADIGCEQRSSKHAPCSFGLCARRVGASDPREPSAGRLRDPQSVFKERLRIGSARIGDLTLVSLWPNVTTGW